MRIIHAAVFALLHGPGFQPGCRIRIGAANARPAGSSMTDAGDQIMLSRSLRLRTADWDGHDTMIERRLAMQEPRRIGETVKQSIIGSVRGTGEVVNAVTDTVTGTVASALRGAGNIGQALTGAVSDVARGVIHGTREVGGDLGAAAKGAMIGTLRGVKEVGGAAIDTVGATVENLVKTTADVGGDIGAAAKQAIESTLQGARSVGVDAFDAAGAAAGGAVRAAAQAGGDVARVAKSAVGGTISGARESASTPPRRHRPRPVAPCALPEAVEQVRRSATGLISGVKVVIREPFRKH